jgi:NTE family protein
MAGGESFGITPRRFDDICSDYDSLPVATGVAASAAFPVALSPVDFQNHSGGCAGKVRAVDWARVALSNPYTPSLDLPRYKDARYTNDLRQGANPFRKIDYLHFLDGGLADNLGIASLRAALVEPYDDAHILRNINLGQVQRLVIIAVNARSDPPSAIYQNSGTPGIIGAVNSVISVPIDANTANSQLALTNLLTEIGKGAAIASDAKFAGMKVYGVSIDFDQLPADTPQARALRDAVKDVPTSWTISDDQLRATEKAGAFLLQNDPCYQALLRDLGIPAPTAAVSGGPACNTEITIPRGS